MSTYWIPINDKSHMSINTIDESRKLIVNEVHIVISKKRYRSASGKVYVKAYTMKEDKDDLICQKIISDKLEIVPHVKYRRDFFGTVQKMIDYYTLESDLK